MPRRPRVNLAGHRQHVVQRGHNREACLFAEEDYQLYLHWLRESAGKYGCAIHAYALMTNHVHLLLTPATPHGLSRLMQSLNRRYAQNINRRYRRSGSVWEGRYKASLINAEEYLLACQRYIELNPVRADVVADHGAYRWHGLGERNDLIADHPLYLDLGRIDEARRAVYRTLFRAYLEEAALDDIRKAVWQGLPLGKENSFIPARSGIYFIGADTTLTSYVGLYGLYRYFDDNKRRRVVAGRIGPRALSLDGCKLALGNDDRRRVDGARQHKLQVVDLCMGDRRAAA